MSNKLKLEIGKVTKYELAKLSIGELKKLYELFYRQIFNLDISFSDEMMPKEPEKSVWPICVAGGISNDILFEGGKSKILKGRFFKESFAKILLPDIGRDKLTCDYIVLTPSVFEIENILRGIPLNDIENRGTNILMFRERWILGLFIFWLTGCYLDLEGITLTGSRHLIGSPFGINFNKTKRMTYVHVYIACSCSCQLGVREAFSLL